MDAFQETGSTQTKNPAELALELYNLLFPHSSDVRQKAIQAAMTSLGEAPVLPRPIGSGASLASGQGDLGDIKLGPKAARWAQKHGISRAMLDEVFHLGDDSMEIIASSLPGPSRREMTIQCYLLSGVRGLLREDTSNLDDSETIALCKRLAAYDKNNHPTYRTAVGNRMTGTKPSFVLTGPGEAAAAELLKQIATRAGD